MLKIYRDVEDPDGIYGVIESLLNKPSALEDSSQQSAAAASASPADVNGGDNDMDGIVYAAMSGRPVSASSASAPGPSFASDLLLLEHERDWSNSLPIYDSIVHAQQARLNVLSSAAPSLTLAPSTDVHAGLVRSLQNLGCHELLLSYFDHIGRRPEIMRDLSDQQYEAAWRAGSWDDRPDLVAAATASSSIEVCSHVFVCLLSFSCADVVFLS